MGERTRDDLRQKQALPLSVKVLLTKARIREWVNEFGEDGVYISFSGGKDSTVLLHLVRENYPNVPAVFCDTGLEYPEIRDFVKKFDNVIWLKPKMNFRKVIEKYGYPLISKEVSQDIYEARQNPGGRVDSKFDDNSPYVKRYGKAYSQSKWNFLKNSDIPISHKCCNVMKKSITKKFSKETGRMAITGQMAEESRLRTTIWIKYGCNAFESKRPISNPMSFWTEQDVLHYIKKNNIEICSVYGEIIRDEEVDGQLTWGISEDTAKLKTTGADRTGCMFCGFGCHLDEPGKGRFERMKETHPKQYEYIMKPWDEGGLGYKEVIDWINEHGNLHIRY